MHVHRPGQLRLWAKRAAVGAAAVLLWLMFAPASMGGLVTLVVVDGQSMEPMLSTGDLVVAVRKPTYAIGDLVVFEIGPGSRVIHRLVATAPDDSWRTQGDNKPSRDPWIVPTEHVKGAFVAGIPAAGGALAWLQRTPLAVALMAGLLVLGMLLPWGGRMGSSTSSARPIRRRDLWAIALGCLMGGAGCLLAAVVFLRAGSAVASWRTLGIGVGGAIAVALGTLLLGELVGDSAPDASEESHRIGMDA